MVTLSGGDAGRFGACGAWLLSLVSLCTGLLPAANADSGSKATSPALTIPGANSDVIATALGRAPASAPAPTSDIVSVLPDGAWRVVGGGREAYMGQDEGAFVGVETDAPNFDFMLRIRRGPVPAKEGASTPPNSKVGLVMRAGLLGTERAYTVRYDGFRDNQCVQWFLRYRVAPSAHDGSRRCFTDGIRRDLNARDNYWLRLERRYPHVRALHSADGKTFVDVSPEYAAAMMDQRVFAGLQLTAGGDGKTPVAVEVDHWQMAIRDDLATRREAEFAGVAFPPRPFVMHYTHINAGTEKSPTDALAFVLMPLDMKPEQIRGIFYASGSKEETIAGDALPFRSGSGKVRVPQGGDGPTGRVVLNNVGRWNHLFASQGWVRIGGVFEGRSLGDAIDALAEQTGMAHLRHLPIVASGASFAAGVTMQAQESLPERMVATAPTLLGATGHRTTVEAALGVPTLHVYGSIDGSHLTDVFAAASQIRARRALWANAPMWHVAHRQHRAFTLIWPYFMECFRLRVPPEADPRNGPVTLNALAESTGWVGLLDTTRTNHPVVMDFASYQKQRDALKATSQPMTASTGPTDASTLIDWPKRDRLAADAIASGRIVWLPSELTARLWAAFCANHPRTVIHHPADDGTSTLGGPIPTGYRHTALPANEPFDLVLSGPVGPGVTRRYMAGLTELQPLSGGDTGTPALVRLPGLPAGVHTLWVETRSGDQSELSPPVTIQFINR